MGGKSNTWENELLQLEFNNVNSSGIGDATGLRGSQTAGNFYISLYTSDPGESGNQSTNETNYTGYSRVAVPRTSSGFTVSLNSANFVNNVDFGACSAAPGSPITHFGIGDDPTGAGKLRRFGTVTPNITMAVGVQPRLLNSANLVTED